MSCERARLLGRFLVQSPEVLENLDWAGHLDECPACRGEREAFHRSIVVYRHLEQLETREDTPQVAWAGLARRLASEHHRTQRARRRTPWLYGIAGVLAIGAVAGGGIWLGALTSSPVPLASTKSPPTDVASRRPVTRQAASPVSDDLLQNAVGGAQPQMSRRPDVLSNEPLPPFVSRRAQAELLEMALFPNRHFERLAGDDDGPWPVGLRPGSRRMPPVTTPVTARTR